MSLQKLEATKSNEATLVSKNRQIIADIVQHTTTLRQYEKDMEHLQQIIENMEKARENQLKAAAETAETVRIVTCRR